MANHVTCPVKKIVKIDDNSCEVHRASMLGDRVNVMVIGAPRERVEDWLASPPNRPYVQNAFPDLCADQREFLLSGMTPEEWEETMGSTEGY